MKTIVKIVKHSEEIVGCGFLILFVGLAIINVILRYFFGFILSWAEEVILIAFVWCVFLGTITGYRNDRHVAIDVIFNQFPVWLQKAIDLGTAVMLLALNAYMTYLGIIMCMHLGNKSTYVLRLSYVYVNLPLVICFAAMTVFSVLKLIAKLSGHYDTTDSLTRVINEEISRLEHENGNNSEKE